MLQLEDQKTIGNFPSEKWRDLKWMIKRELYNNSTASVNNFMSSYVLYMSLKSTYQPSSKSEDLV